MTIFVLDSVTLPSRENVSNDSWKKTDTQDYLQM